MIASFGRKGCSDPDRDFPHITAQLAPHGGIGRVVPASCANAAQSVMESGLGTPTNLAQGRLPLRHRGQAPLDSALQARAKSITMGRLDQYAPQMDVAGFGDVTAPLRAPTGRFAGNEPGERHERRRASKLAEVPRAVIQSMSRRA